MIEQEKKRINYLENITKEDEAAVIIQKTWRGFSFRRNKRKMLNTPK